MGFNQLFLPLFLQMVILIELLPSSAPILASPSFPIEKHDCDDRCGNVSIPFPFGTKKGCYLNEDFFINCTYSSHTNVQQPLLPGGDVEVIEISFKDQYMRVLYSIGYDCYNQDGSSYSHLNTWMKLAKGLTFSSKANKFTTVGCDTYSIVRGFTKDRGDYLTGCVSYCERKEDVKDHSSCDGIGCCQTPIPSGAWQMNVTLTSYSNHTGVWNFNNCSYAFPVQVGAFQFFADNLTNLYQISSLPVVVDWTIDNMNCRICSNNSRCEEIKGLGKRCLCEDGYDGNPYLPDGCQDIDECIHNGYTCTKNSACINTLGNYTCPCLEGHHGDGREGGEGCSPDQNHNETIHYWPMIVSGQSIFENDWKSKRATN